MLDRETNAGTPQRIRVPMGVVTRKAKPRRKAWESRKWMVSIDGWLAGYLEHSAAHDHFGWWPVEYAEELGIDQEFVRRSGLDWADLEGRMSDVAYDAVRAEREQAA